jgi:AraC family transcriptional regulator of adaptative response / DNA-3-methyladenine glycosylase II
MSTSQPARIHGADGSPATRSRTAELDFDACYRAVSSRDARFDGRFYTAVTSTGIYCRPICPARTPARTNIRFYRHAASAEAAGFRPCRRCRPEVSPGAPGWDVRADLVGRALRLIDDGVADDHGVAGLAQRLHVTERHLHRLFIAEIGTGPLAVARTRRLLLAKQLLTETSLPITDVAFAAGFGSVRQFNATMKDSYGFAPSELRKTAAAPPVRPGGPVQDAEHALRGGTPRSAHGKGGAHGMGGTHAGGAAGTAGALTLRLSYRPPYDARSLFRFLASRAIPGVELVTWPPRPDDDREGGREDGRPGAHATGAGGMAADGPAAGYHRAIAGGWIGLLPADDHIRLTVWTADTRQLARIVARCRRLLDLDADPAAITEALGSTGAERDLGHAGVGVHDWRPPGSSNLAALVRRNPGLRVPGAFDGFELAVRAVVGQQISVAGARTILGRIAARAGIPVGQTATFPPGSAPGADVPGPLSPTSSLPPPFLPATLFPTAPQLAEADLSGLGLTNRRVETLKSLAGAVAAGDIDLDGGAPPAETAARLSQVPGIGPWTIGYIALRALGDPDAWPAGDLALTKAMARLEIPPEEADRWRPWRSYAALHLWNA